VVGRGQTRREEPDRGQGDGARGEHVEDDGKAPGGTRHLDPVVRLAVREPQHVAAVRVQGTVAFTEIQVASVQLGEVCDELSRRVALARDEALHTRDEIRMGEASERGEDIVLHIRL